MTQTSRTRLFAAALACGVALAALPLAQAWAEPNPPAPPAAPRTESRTVVIHQDGDDDEAALHSRVVTRDGKTFVFKTAQPLSDAELERRIAEAEALLPPLPAAPPVPGQRVEKRIIVHDGERTVDVEELPDCASKVADVDAASDDAGKHTRVRIRVCGDEGDSPAQALGAVRRARAEVAAKSSMPADLRAEVLGELDGEIAKLEKDAG